MTKTYKLGGLDCPSCTAMLECDLEDAGIKAKCSFADSSLKVEGDHEYQKVVDVVRKSGYIIK